MVNKYRQIKAKWDANPNLKQLLPDHYQKVCNKLEALEAGAKFTVRDVTLDCLKAGWALLCGGQMGHKSNGRVLPFCYSTRYQKGVDKLVKSIQKEN